MGAFTDVVSLSSVPAPLYRDRFKRFMELVVFNDDPAVPKTVAESLKLDQTNASSQAPLEPVTLDKHSAELIQTVQTCKGQFISNIAELNNFVRCVFLILVYIVIVATVVMVDFVKC